MRVRRVGARVHAVVWAGGLACGLLGAAPAAAQVVRGVVVEQGRSAPVAGVVVTLEDSAGRVVASALSGESGAYSLRAPQGGRYALRAKRIGVRPVVSPPFTLAAGAVREERLETLALAAPLAAVRVKGHPVCGARMAGDTALVRLWEDARAALVATALTRRSERVETAVALFERELDPRTGRVRAEARRAERWTTARPFYAAPAGELSRAGYARQEADGTTSFYAPDPDVLLSDAFLAEHCFQVVPGEGRTQRGLVGLQFEPAPARTVPEVRGVLWLDAATSELRRMEYRYTRLRGGRALGDAGGALRFSRLGTGGWLIDHWSIRVPVYAKVRSQMGLRSDVARDRDSVVALREEGGEVVEVSPVAAPGAAVAGVVADSGTGAPLAGARVAIAGSAHEATADSAGRFVLEGVPAGEHRLRIRHARLDSAGIEALEQPLTVREGATYRVQVLVARPTPTPAAAGGVAVRARVLDQETGAPLPDVDVLGGPTVLSTSDAHGEFTVTAPRGGALTLLLRKDGYEGRTVTAEVRAGDSSVARFALRPRPSGSTALAGFERRRRAGLGRFFTREEILRRRPARLSDLLLGIPGVLVTGADRGAAVAVASRGAQPGVNESGEVAPTSCPMRLAIDGRVAPFGQQLDEISPAAIAAVEVYTGASSIPRDFSQADGGAWCGLIVIWTLRGD